MGNEMHAIRRDVAVLSFSRIVSDRRVLRQCALLKAMGYDPKLIVYADNDEAVPYEIERWPVPRPTTVHRLKTVVRQLPAHLGARAARAGFWIEPRHRWAYSMLARWRPPLIIANDWPALVVAAAYKRRFGGKIHYDTHEFATLEFDERWWWRLIYKPMVQHLESNAIRYADSISTVGPELAKALQSHYRLPELPSVIRNIPESIPLPTTIETTWPLRLLYHGQVLPDRGLECLIGSMAFWKTPHSLTIRGNGAAPYIAALKLQAERLGVAASIIFEPAVPPERVMPIAAETADVGVHFTPLDTLQRHFSLPNKFFEYIGAGLAVAVSPGADLRRIVEELDVGLTSTAASPEAVADAINSLTEARVRHFKVKAREAAKSLCWEVEQQVLRSVLERHRGVAL